MQVRAVVKSSLSPVATNVGAVAPVVNPKSQQKHTLLYLQRSGKERKFHIETCVFLCRDSIFRWNCSKWGDVNSIRGMELSQDVC